MAEMPVSDEEQVYAPNNTSITNQNISSFYGPLPTDSFTNVTENSRVNRSNSYITDSSISSDTTDDFHKEQLEMLANENEAKTLALEKVTKQNRSLKDQSILYQQNLKDRDDIIEKLTLELQNTQDHIARIKQKLKDRGLQSTSVSEAGSNGDLTPENRDSVANSPRSDISSAQITELQKKLEQVEKEYNLQKEYLDNVKRQLRVDDEVSI